MNDPLILLSVTRTLRLRVKRDAYPWLRAAARNILTAGLRCRASVRGNESPILPETARAAA